VVYSESRIAVWHALTARCGSSAHCRAAFKVLCTEHPRQEVA
jgi:hypothetical protein